MLKTVSSRYPNAVPKLIQEFALDVKHLLETGIYSQDGATHVQFYHLGTKGDLPALKTLGSFKRSFSNVPRGGSTKRPCQGICFLCSAGREATPGVGAIPYEDVNPTALWVSTISQEVPWDSTPAIVQGLPLDEHHQMKFFLTDLWHNAHLGVCRHFVASAIVGILESRLASLPAGSMEVKFDWISRVYRDYFQSIGKPHLWLKSTVTQWTFQPVRHPHWRNGAKHKHQLSLWCFCPTLVGTTFMVILMMLFWYPLPLLLKIHVNFLFWGWSSILSFMFFMNHPKWKTLTVFQPDQ